MAFMRLLIVLLIFGMLMTSGCITKENSILPDQEPSTNVTGKPIVKNEPDIEIASYYFVYMGDNPNRSTLFHEKNYIAFNLSIHNNDTDPIHFRSNDLQLHGANRIFKKSTIDSKPFGRADVWEDLEKEITLRNNTILLPNETIKGTVIFRMEDIDVVSNRSFSLLYNGSLITSASFEKSLTALLDAELFNYSTAFGIPAYEGSREDEFPEINYYYIWPNWVNMSVVEYYKKTDLEYLTAEDPSNPPSAEISYLVRVVPQRNITVLSGDRLIVVDDTKEELMNRSIYRKCCGGLYLAIRNGETYEYYAGDVPQMNLKNATVVQFSFSTLYGWGLAMRLSYNNQDVILDEDHGIVLARYDYQHFIS